MSSNSRTAFILQVHNNPDQVNKFIKQLTIDDQADVFVHIDKKNRNHLIGKIVKSVNVKISQQSVSCEWGDISQIDATLHLLREAVSSKNEYDYVCLRSGQDLLIKNGFKEFLSTYNSNIFMSVRKMSLRESAQIKIKWPKVTRKRYTGIHPIRMYRRLLIEFYSRGINILPNTYKLPVDYELYKGSQWFTLPMEVVRYMIKFLDENEWYYRCFENALVPDECFFQTLIMNSPYKNNVINNNLFFIRWGEKLSERNSPSYLKKEDINAIEKSNQYFARKFDEQIDQSVVDYFSSQIGLEGTKLEKSLNA